MKSIRKIISCILSICIHFLLLIIFLKKHTNYNFSQSTSIQAYEMEILFEKHTTSSISPSSHSMAITIPYSSSERKNIQNFKNKLHDFQHSILKKKKKKIDTSISKKDEGSSIDQIIHQIDTVIKDTQKIDQRALYSNNLDELNVLLDMAGWRWDIVPQPKDTSEECGKIVFEITVDDLGEIIAVRTLEKTIGPLVEKIYRIALENSTFKKIDDQINYHRESTGKVSFFIRTQ